MLRKEYSDTPKANKNHLQDLQTAHYEYSSELSGLRSSLERAESRAKDAEGSGKAALQRAFKVRIPLDLY